MTAPKRTPTQLGFERWKRELAVELSKAENQQAKESLRELDHRCDGELIRRCLWMLSDDPARPRSDSWKSLYGFDRPSLKTVDSTLRKAANILEKMNAGSVAKTYLLIPPFRDEGLRLPLVLRCYAAICTTHRKNLRRTSKDHFETRFWRWRLSEHVKLRIGRPCHRQLAELYSMITHSCCTYHNWADLLREDRQTTQLFTQYWAADMWG